MKTLAIIALAMLTTAARAETTQYFDANGQYLGEAHTSGGNTQYLDASGRYQGEAQSSGHTTQYFDALGRYLGEAQ
jgi:hypothetical protein